MDSQSPPKGSLEELFRHHLLESEAAAVPPRPLVWDQIDNSLLLAENKKYRRRLLVHRWGMAASLLLAALAGGGWWRSQQLAAPNLAVATSTGPAARVAAATASPTRATAGRPGTAHLGTVAASGMATPLVGSAAELASTSPTQPAVGASQRLAAAGATNLGHAGAPAFATYAYSTHAASRRGVALADAQQAISSSSYAITSPIGSTSTLLPAGSPDAAATLGRAADTSAEEALAGSELAANRMGERLLAGKTAALALGAGAGLPASLTPIEFQPIPVTKLRGWRFEAAYAASAFNPNVDFAAGGNYNPVASNSLSAPKFSAIGKSAAAAEYRSNQRAGLGQRLSLRATRWLGGHWSLSTGLEAAQQEATSATSVGFDGVTLNTGTAYSMVPPTLQTSSYRYRSVGVPVELRYDNPIKPGVSFYGRLGAIVSALLNVRTELAGNPETARSYAPFAGSTPYRRLTTLLRGGAGVRYRPANKSWGVSVGPTAEAGVQSLNSDTDKSFLQQSRPYSFGLEAGFEFNSGVVPVQ